jgi:hypothetical protein
LEVAPPFTVAFRRDGDVMAYAEAYTGFMRAITEPVIRSALKQPDQDGGIVERLYDRIRARLQADPQRYRWRYIVVAALLTRPGR